MPKSPGIFLYSALTQESILTKEVIYLLKYLQYNFGKRYKEENKTENLTKQSQLEIED